jgi:hypothetical protein
VFYRFGFRPSFGLRGFGLRIWDLLLAFAAGCSLGRLGFRPPAFALADNCQGSQRRFTFRSFLAFTLAPRKLDPTVVHRAFENSVVVGPGRRNYMVPGRFG